jgi:UvrD-like helicase C-terminal domain
LILAADPYQLLDGATEGCPAVEWVENLGAEGLEECLRLVEPHRYVNSKIFEAAQCLRERRAPTNETVPLYLGQCRPIAFTILERLQLGWKGPVWTGTTAIISPSVGKTVEAVLQSLAEQGTRRGRKPIRWTRQNTSDAEQNSLFKALGVGRDHLDDSEWNDLITSDDLHTSDVMELSRRFARLKGLSVIPKHLVSTIAGQVISTARARSSRAGRFIVTTVHGAKNCEYDNVIVIWSYQVPPGNELQARLLYNAVTRAQNNCIVFDTRQKKVAMADEALALIGTLKPVSEKSLKKASSSRSKSQDVCPVSGLLLVSHGSCGWGLTTAR